MLSYWCIRKIRDIHCNFQYDLQDSFERIDFNQNANSAHFYKGELFGLAIKYVRSQQCFLSMFFLWSHCVKSWWIRIDFNQNANSAHFYKAELLGLAIKYVRSQQCFLSMFFSVISLRQIMMNQTTTRINNNFYQ